MDNDKTIILVTARGPEKLKHDYKKACAILEIQQQSAPIEAMNQVIKYSKLAKKKQKGKILLKLESLN